MQTEKRKKRHQKKKKIPFKHKGKPGETEFLSKQTSNIQTPRRDSGKSGTSARKEPVLEDVVQEGGVQGACEKGLQSYMG